MTSQSNNKNIFTALSVEESTQIVEVIKQTGSNKIDDCGVQDEKSNPIPVAPNTFVSSFPVLLNGNLGAVLSKKEQKEISDSNIKTFVDTAAANFESASVFSPNSRTSAFERMADPTQVARSLKCTKACRLVTEPTEDNVTQRIKAPGGVDKKFGTCYREICGFAHSEEELQAPMCSFDKDCRFVHGRKDYKTDKIQPGTKCKFRHSFETTSGWLKRSGVEIPTLPLTNKLSRKSINKTETMVARKKTIEKFSPKTMTQENSPSSQTHKSRWDEKPGETKPTKTKTKPIKIKFKSSDSDSSDSDSSDSDLEKTRRSPSKRLASNVQIIRVPNEDLAKFALQEAFKMGNFNVQVIIE
jgi:hypothetical protein